MEDKCQRENVEQIFFTGCCLATFFVIAVCWIIKQEIIYREVTERRQLQYEHQLEHALFSLNNFKINWNEYGNGFVELEE